MAFYKFGKKLQVLLIAGAMAGAPACYESSNKTGDVGGDDVTITDVEIFRHRKT